jgi:hypothetical protein
MLNLNALVWLAVIALLIIYAVKAMRARETAYRAARRHCDEMDVQILDQNVYLRRIWFKRNDAGRLSLWRTFYFEFTFSGADRYFGRVIMLGRRVEKVRTGPSPACEWWAHSAGSIRTSQPWASQCQAHSLSSEAGSDSSKGRRSQSERRNAASGVAGSV